MMKALLGVMIFAASAPQGTPADLLQAVRIVVADVAAWTATRPCPGRFPDILLSPL